MRKDENAIDPFHAWRDTAKCLIYWKKEFTIKFVTSKLVNTRKKRTTIFKDMFRHAYAIISLIE